MEQKISKRPHVVAKDFVEPHVAMCKQYLARLTINKLQVSLACELPSHSIPGNNVSGHIGAAATRDASSHTVVFGFPPVDV